MIVANYQDDLGNLTGLYPMRIGEDPSNNSLLTFLPQELQDKYRQVSNFRDCRTTALVPRKLTLTFGDDFTQSIEIPVTPTLEQVKAIRRNAGANLIVFEGESVKYNRLKWLVTDTTQ